MYIWGKGSEPGSGRVRLFVGNRGSGRVSVSTGRVYVGSNKSGPRGQLCPLLKSIHVLKCILSLICITYIEHWINEPIKKLGNLGGDVPPTPSQLAPLVRGQRGGREMPFFCTCSIPFWTLVFQSGRHFTHFRSFRMALSCARSCRYPARAPAPNG